MGPLGKRIPEYWIYTSSPGIVQGPWDSSVRVSQNIGATSAVLGLSRDYLISSLEHLCQNTGVILAVLGLSRDYPTPRTPLSEYRFPRMLELYQQWINLGLHVLAFWETVRMVQHEPYMYKVSRGLGWARMLPEAQLNGPGLSWMLLKAQASRGSGWARKLPEYQAEPKGFQMGRFRMICRF